MKLRFCVLLLMVSMGFACPVVGAQTDSPSASAQSPQPVTVTIAPSEPIKVEMPKSPAWSYWLAPVLSAVIALTGSWIGFSFSQKNTRRTIDAALAANEVTTWQKSNEAELSSIQERLDKFYAPLVTRLQADHQLAQDIRSRQAKGFRLLSALFDPVWKAGLSVGEQKLVEMVVEHGSKLEEMILNAGSIDPQLVPYFSRAVSHFKILRLAHAGDLGTDPDRFAQYVYPRQLDHVLELEMERLRNRVNALRNSPGKSPGSFPKLTIPSTSDYVLPPWIDPDGRMIQPPAAS